MEYTIRGVISIFQNSNRVVLSKIPLIEELIHQLLLVILLCLLKFVDNNSPQSFEIYIAIQLVNGWIIGLRERKESERKMADQVKQLTSAFNHMVQRQRYTINMREKQYILGQERKRKAEEMESIQNKLADKVKKMKAQNNQENQFEPVSCQGSLPKRNTSKN